MVMIAGAWGDRDPGYTPGGTESWMALSYNPSHRIYDDLTSHQCEASGDVTHIVLAYGGLDATARSINYVVANGSNVILRQGISTGWNTSNANAQQLVEIAGVWVWALRIQLSSPITVNEGDILRAGFQFSLGSATRIRRIDATPDSNSILFWSNQSGDVPLNTAWPDPITHGTTALNRRPLCWFEGNSGAVLTFSQSPSVSARSSSGYTLQGATSQQANVYAVAVLATDTAPTTPAQIIAGNNGANAPARGAGNVTTSGSSPWSLSITGGTLGNNPLHHIYVVAHVAPSTYSNIAVISGQLLGPAAGKTLVITGVPWEVGHRSILEGADPAAVDSSVIEHDAATSPGTIPVTVRVDGTFAFGVEDDYSVQAFNYRLWRNLSSEWSNSATVTVSSS